MTRPFGKSGKELVEASPVTYVKNITAPVLLMHGEDDRIVRESQSRLMVKALKRAKKKHQYIKIKDTTHYFRNQAGRTQLFEAMDTFLARHLPVDE